MKKEERNALLSLPLIILLALLIAAAGSQGTVTIAGLVTRPESHPWNIAWRRIPGCG